METRLKDGLCNTYGKSARHALAGAGGIPRETDALAPLHLLIFRNDEKIRPEQSKFFPSWDALEEFSRRLGVALGAPVGSLDIKAAKRRMPICGVEGCDCHHLVLSAGLIPARVRNLPASFFILQQPSWPVRNILFFVQAARADNLALDWVVRMARVSHARVTVLAVVPPVPEMFSSLSRMQIKIRDVLASDTKLGSRLRHISQQLYRQDIQAELVLRQGLPGSELSRQLCECAYDLVVLASTFSSKAACWLTGELDLALSQRIHMSTLVARPQPT